MSVCTHRIKPPAVRKFYFRQDITALSPCCGLCASARLLVDHASQCAQLCCAIDRDAEVDVHGLCPEFRCCVADSAAGG